MPIAETAIVFEIKKQGNISYNYMMTISFTVPTKYPNDFTYHW